jgi:ATP-dependent exoDNAse (exonuclease V) beta subunit
VYKWLRELDDAEEHAELGRLLYVGATRARQRLHVTAVGSAAADGRDWRRPGRGSALERIWDALAVRPPLPDPFPAVPPPTASVPQSHDLMRLADDWRPPAFPAALPVESDVTVRSEAPVFDWADAIAAAIGTVSHRLLAQVASEGLAAWDERRLHAERERIEAELGSEGVERDLCPRAAQRVATVLARTLGDPRGRWLFDATHAHAHSEWALAGIDEGRVVHIVVDRSFVANGTRYVVDFKTGEHQGGDSAAFLRAEFDRYYPQLARYARIVGAFDPTPIRIALYHPLVDGGWQEQAVAPAGAALK